MITIVATFTVPEANRGRFAELGRRLVAGSLAETGNISYQLVVAREDAGAFAFIEGWADDAAIDNHNGSTHFTTLIPQLVELSSGDPVITQYEAV